MRKSSTYLIILLAFFVASCSKEPINNITPEKSNASTLGNLNSKRKPKPDRRGNESDNNNMLLGNPDGAQPNIVLATKYLMDEKYYIESYNNTTHCPNWVSWHLDASDLGPVKRSNDFRANDALPSAWYAVNQGSYQGSGFDRGHNCPSGDRTSTHEANSRTFLMTNMIPQAPKNNRQTWESLESYTRSLIRDGSNEAYITVGSYGSGGTGSNGYMEVLNDEGAQINVPDHFWKVVVVIPVGSDDLNRIDANTRVIAINTPNTNSLDPDWRAYRTSVKAIEMASGFRLLTSLPPAVQAALKSKVDDL